MPTSSARSAVANGFGSDDRVLTPRVLVFGASGFLGRHVTRRLDELGDDRFAVGRSGAAGLDASIDLATAPQHDIDRLVAKVAPSAVVNCSGATSGSTADLMQGNVVAVHALLSAMARSAPTARLVQLGSSAEYGGAPIGTSMDENTPTQPRGAYGFTKLGGSNLVVRARSQGADAVLFRIFNVSGPESPPSTLLGRIVDKLRGSGPEPVLTLGSLDAWRDYVDARDVAEAVCIAATSGRPVPPVLNLGRGDAVHTRSLVEQLVAVSKSDATIVEEAAAHAGHAGSSASAVAWQQADITAAMTYLGWTPAIDTATSITDTWTGRD